MKEIKKQLDELKIEDFIWLIYLFISIAALYSNQIEREYIKTKSKNKYNSFHKINTIILTIAFFIYLYFVLKNYNNVKNLKKNINIKKHYDANLLLISSILFLVAGSIALFIEYKNINDNEIGFI